MIGAPITRPLILGGPCPSCERTVDTIAERKVPHIPQLCEPPEIPYRTPGSIVRTLGPCGCEA